jgi:hypothetical protein
MFGAAAALNVDELGAVLTSLGSNGDGRDRLAAVVALLTSGEGDRGDLVRGAFAGIAPTATAKVSGAFTSALHACLRDLPVNAGEPANTSSASRK